MYPVQNQNLPAQVLNQQLKEANIDIELIEPVLDYANSVLELQIRIYRDYLMKQVEMSLRHEYLARIDSLQIVKSQLTLSALAGEIGKLNKEETKLNVY